jgi:hypothetical protein
LSTSILSGSGRSTPVLAVLVLVLLVLELLRMRREKK